MIEIEAAAVDDIWADSFWTCKQEKNKLNEETGAKMEKSSGCVDARLIRLNRSVCTGRRSYNHQMPRLHRLCTIYTHYLYYCTI